MWPDVGIVRGAPKDWWEWPVVLDRVSGGLAPICTEAVDAEIVLAASRALAKGRGLVDANKASLEGVAWRLNKGGDDAAYSVFFGKWRRFGVGVVHVGIYQAVRRIRF